MFVVGEPGRKKPGVLVDVYSKSETSLKLKNGRPSKASLQRAKRDLNDRQVSYAAWLATPEAYRQPRTRTELAKQLGVSEYTLWRWDQNPKIVLASRWMVLQRAGDPGRVGQIIDFLHEVATDEVQTTKYRLEAAREYLAAVGVKQMWKNPEPELLQVTELSDIDLEMLSDDEVWEMYNELAGNNGDPLKEADDEGSVE